MISDNLDLMMKDYRGSDRLLLQLIEYISMICTMDPKDREELKKMIDTIKGLGSFKKV